MATKIKIGQIIFFHLREYSVRIRLLSFAWCKRANELILEEMHLILETMISKQKIKILWRSDGSIWGISKNYHMAMGNGRWEMEDSKKISGMSLKELRFPAKDRWRRQAHSHQKQPDANGRTLRCSIILLYFFCMIPTPQYKPICVYSGISPNNRVVFMFR